MLNQLLLIILLALAPSESQTGWASQYAPGVMERVVRTRQGWSQLPEDLSICQGFIAVRECDDIGNIYAVRPEGGDWELLCAADCASKSDFQGPDDPRSGYEWMVDGKILMEVGNETARRWDVVNELAPGVEMVLVGNLSSPWACAR